MKTEMIAIDKLVPYERNAKTHPASQIKKLAEIITKVGFRQPVLVDNDLVIITGHGRLLAAREAGLTEVPVNIATDLSPEQVKAYRIADNEISKTDWDDELLREELAELEKDFPEMLAQLAMDEKEIEQRLAGEYGKKKVSFDVESDPKLTLTISFENEDDQQDLFIELRDRGFKVKV